MVTNLVSQAAKIGKHFVKHPFDDKQFYMKITARFFILSIFFSSACHLRQQVDLLVHHARIYTVNKSFSIEGAMAVRGHQVLAVGSEDEIMQKYQSDNVVDAGGKTIYPGWIDAHAHFVEYAQSLFQVDLTGCLSWDEAVQRVTQFSALHPDLPWILGQGWDQNKFPKKAFPDNRSLNALFPDKPVLLSRIDGHAALANAKALSVSAILPGQLISGGTIETVHHELTGILIDNAVGLVSLHVPPVSGKDFLQRLQAAQKNCLAAGLTTITDCGLSYETAMQIDSLQKLGILQLQLYVMLRDDPASYRKLLQSGPYKTDRLFINGFKLYADGALGSRGACLLQPYQDRPGWRGFLLSPRAHFDSVAALLAPTKFQMCTHAIGDSANRMILEVYRKYLPGKNDRRWRVEHAQVVTPGDRAFFGRYSIIPSVQPTHATSDMYWAESRLGNRIRNGYAYQSLLKQNGWIPLGTDFPVEDISPLKTFHSAVFRKDAAGYPPAGFQVDEALSREDALRGMTIWAAKADFLDKEVGSLEPGKKADFIIVDQDLLRVPESKVLSCRVTATYINGVKVF